MWKYIISVIFVFIPVVSFAAESSGIEPRMGWRIINFVVFVGILYYFLRKPVAEFFRTRKETIKEELEEAERLQIEAEKLLEETKEKLDKLELEIKNILDTFDSMAKNEREQILKEVEVAIKRILKSVEEEKAFMISRARMVLLRKISKEAMDNLRRKFGHLSAEEHKKINDKFIRSLQQ